MTQEEKQLLLKDLCGRLPYGVMVKVEGEKYFNETKEPYITSLSLNNYILDYNDVTITPYLRPMSSMTEKESAIKYKLFGNYILDNCPAYIDWLNAHHFDYRELIPMGLALEAPEDMYKTE